MSLLQQRGYLITMSEQRFQFDKFVRDLEERERLQRDRRELLNQQEEEWAARELVAKYREHPHNRITRRDNSEN